VQLESATREVEEEVLEVFVEEMVLLLEDVVDEAFVEVVVFFVEVVETARMTGPASSIASPLISPITAAEAARLREAMAQIPSSEKRILSSSSQKMEEGFLRAILGLDFYSIRSLYLLGAGNSSWRETRRHRNIDSGV
jgi:hypothetical protein